MMRNTQNNRMRTKKTLKQMNRLMIQLPVNCKWAKKRETPIISVNQQMKQC